MRNKVLIEGSGGAGASAAPMRQPIINFANGAFAEQTLTERERERRKEGRKGLLCVGGGAARRRCGIGKCHHAMPAFCAKFAAAAVASARPRLWMRHQRSFGDDEAHISTVKAPSLFYSVVACSIGASEGSGVVQKAAYLVCLFDRVLPITSDLKTH